jgi:hypothetical protein
MQRLSTGIDSWIIQDGNYGDFAIGETRKFALEFGGKQLIPALTNELSAQLVRSCVYRVCAKVVYVHPEVWVIDFGLLAYWHSKPPTHAKVGSWVEGEILIGIDPFFYMDDLHKLPDIPKLIYNWKVDGILRNDAPWLVESVDERGSKTLRRDTNHEIWSKVERTEAWEDDGGSADYVLQCVLVEN